MLPVRGDECVNQGVVAVWQKGKDGIGLSVSSTTEVCKAYPLKGLGLRAVSQRLSYQVQDFALPETNFHCTGLRQRDLK